MLYLKHLSKDKKLKKILSSHPPVSLKRKNDLFHHLCASIISQQLSTKVAEVIYNRFVALHGNTFPGPERVLETKHEKLRSIGLSNNKAGYIHNVARFAIENGMDTKKLHKLSNEEVIDHLTTIKGVGKWTVEMQLMFTLGREDVFPADDLGIQNAMKKLYRLDDSDKKQFREKLIRISEKWKPYRTYACFHLWKWKDGEGV